MTIEIVTPEKAWEYLEEKASAQLLDVRTSKEIADGFSDLSSLNKKIHSLDWLSLSGSTSTPFTEALNEAFPDKTQPLFFLCRSGKRSAAAAQAAKDQGYTNLYNIAGGFFGSESDPGWLGQALPVTIEGT